MSDPATQHAPALAETEAALIRMPASMAKIIRRRMGLAPAEPEMPKAEPESSARAASRPGRPAGSTMVRRTHPTGLSRLKWVAPWPEVA